MRPRLNSMLDVAERIFLWPLLGGVTSIAGVLAGYLGSLYVDEVKQALIPWFLPNGSFAAGASLFWLSTVIFGMCFTGTFWAQSRSSRRATDGLYAATNAVAFKTDSLATKADTLDQLIRQLHTLPPQGFLEIYREAVGLADEAFYSVWGSHPTREELAIALRTQLVCVLRLATNFDEDGDKAKYGCNLMLFKPIDGLHEQELRKIQERLKFAEKGVSVKNLAGVLDLMPELSISSASGADPDPTLVPFALPIPQLTVTEKSDRSKNGVLPGAPDAFVAEEEVVIESFEDLLNRTPNEYFTSSVRAELRMFFEQKAGSVQSFVSVPLYSRTTSRADPIGVLNIHRNLPNKLAAEKFELFSPLLVPILLSIGRLLWTYHELSIILTHHQETSHDDLQADA